MSKFKTFLEYSTPKWNHSAKKNWDEGSEVYYNVYKTKKGEFKKEHVKQFESNEKGKAEAYAKACNNKSTTHTFTVSKEK